MKPMHKGIGVISLATGATVLAISLIGCSKSEEQAPAVEASTVSESSAMPESSAGSKPSTVKSAPETPATKVAAEHVDDAENKEAVSKGTSIAPPPPGLFHESTDTKTAEVPQAPKAPASPEMPVAPQNVMEQQVTSAKSQGENIKSEPPVAPEVFPKGLAVKPEAPQSPQMHAAKAESPSAPSKTKSAEPAKHADAGIVPAPQMPNIEALKATEVSPQMPTTPGAVKQKIKTPSAPMMEVPNMKSPVQGDRRNPQSVQAMQIPNVGSMQMPTMQMPAMNMNPNMGYAPRMYFVPMPMYQYAQPYAPYGYPRGVAPNNQQVQQPQKSPPQQPQANESN